MAVLLGTVLGTGPVVAGGNENFAITPYDDSAGPTGRSNFVLEGTPGQAITDRVSLFNFTDQNINFRVFPTDAFNTSTGAFTLRMPDGQTGILEPSEDLGAWIELPVQTVVQLPGTRLDIPFTITIPLDAEPGDHVGGIVALDTQARGGEGQDLAVGVKQAQGVRIYVRVAGPLDPQITVDDAALVTGGGGLAAPLTGPRDAEARFTLVNTGNTRLTPTVQLRVTDLFGREVASESLSDLPELLPGQSADQVVPLGELSGFGPRYRLVVTADAQGTEGEGSASAWVFPWLLLPILLILIVVFIVLRRRRSDDDAPRERAASNAPAFDETAGVAP